MTRTRIALTIAGSDSGGGAGIQADLRTFTRMGVFGTTAITAITAQNTRGVRAWSPVLPGLVRSQIDAVATDLRPDSVKSGMLANAAIVRAVVAALRAHELPRYVVDPVILSSSGSALLDGDGIRALRRDLLPLAAIVTPNLAEAAALTGEPVGTIESMRRAALLLVDYHGAKAALVTGGHLTGASAIDVFYDGNAAPKLFRHRRIATRHTHGTGCVLSAAIAARLALGDDMVDAVSAATRYVHRALLAPPSIGSGTGPVG